MSKQFKGFTEQQMKRIAEKLGYTGPMSKFSEFLRSNQGAMNKFAGLNEKVKLKMQEGGTVPPANQAVTQATQPIPAQMTPTYQYDEQTTPSGDATMPEIAAARMSTPGLPVGGTTIAQSTAVEPGQFVTGQDAKVEGDVSVTATQADTERAQDITAGTAATFDADKVTEKAKEELKNTQAQTGSVTTSMEAAEANATETEVGTIPAAQITEATKVKAPASRTLQDGEMVQSTFDAQKAADFAESIQAAQADPSTAALVQGQLDNLMDDFAGGQTPSWAAGAIRNANAAMAARGLSSSSMAGQAILQATMEAALPIAQIDAQTTSNFEMRNLDNRQARAMLAAEQRANFIGREFDQEFQARVMNATKISEIANMNFNAEQTIALENARMAQTVDLQNLSNSQAMVMAEAAQIANLEVTNLNNRQQAAVQNAQAFLQMDMANLNNQQQTEMFKAQSRIQALFSDQAAGNAAKQFNASSQNQTDQFFANLSAQVSQFNAGQANAQSQFNAEQSNVVGRFNAELKSQREQFNAENQLVIEQANAQWRRQIATADTAAVNAANQANAQAILNISNIAYSNLWQEYRDTMEWAWTSTENERQRDSALAIAKLNVDADKYSADAKEDAANSAAWGRFVFDMVSDWI